MSGLGFRELNVVDQLRVGCTCWGCKMDMLGLSDESVGIGGMDLLGVRWLCCLQAAGPASCSTRREAPERIPIRSECIGQY